MLLTHAITLAEARSYIAALDESAATKLGAIGYDHTLICLDAAYGNQVPALTEVPVNDPAALYRFAQQAVTDLGTHGLDPLHIELTLAYLADAWMLDHESETSKNDHRLPAWLDPEQPS